MIRLVSTRLCRVGLLLLLVATASHADAQSHHHRRRTPEATPPAGSTTPPPATGGTGAAPATPAQTTPPEPQSVGARQLFLQGQDAYQRGDYAGAISLWEQALAIDPRPQLHYNLAQAYGRLGRIEEEMAALRHYLDGAPPEDPTVTSARSRLTSLEQRLAQTGIDLTGVYPGARVVVDGQERGAMPMHDGVGVRPGSHSVDIFQEGFEPFHSAVVVPAGERVTISVVLHRGGEVAARPSHPNRLPIVLMATGGALVATGAAFGTLALIRGSGSVSGTADGDRARTFAIISDATLIPGLAVGATGLVVYLLRRGHDDDAPNHASIFPVVGTNHFGVAGRF